MEEFKVHQFFLTKKQKWGGLSANTLVLGIVKFLFCETISVGNRASLVPIYQGVKGAKYGRGYSLKHNVSSILPPCN